MYMDVNLDIILRKHVTVFNNILDHHYQSK